MAIRQITQEQLDPVRVLGDTQTISNWCIFGAGQRVRAWGITPGITVTAEMRYTDFFANPAVLTIGTVGFSVLGTAAPAVPLPATSATALAVLLMLVIGLALLAVRKRREHLLLALLATASLDVRANQWVIDCVGGGSGAPTPAQIVNWVNSKPRVGTPPLQPMHRGPDRRNYLMPDRATGDFQAWLAGNPLGTGQSSSAASSKSTTCPTCQRH